jgi:AAA domain/Bifunctional DNA primase/polymerase, N-terminal
MSATTRLEDLKRVQREWVESQSQTAPSPTVAAVAVAEPVAPQRQPEGFRTIAYRALARNSRMLPIKVGAKKPLVEWAGTEIDVLPLSEWLIVAPDYINDWANRFPSANCCEIGKPNEKCMIDEDSDEFRAGFEKWAGVPFPHTFTTSARAGHRQSHWYQTDKTRALGNVGQDKTLNAVLSLRQKNLYVISEGSQYKDEVNYYNVVDNSSIAPMPDKVAEYIEHLIALKDATKPKKESSDSKSTVDLDSPFIHHQIHPRLVSIAGYYVQNKNISDADELYTLLIAKLEKNGCFYEDGVTPFPYDDKKVRERAENAVSSWKTGEQKRKESQIALTQQPPQAAQAVPASAVAHSADELLDVVKRATFRPFGSRRPGVDYHYESALVHGQLIVWAAPTKGKKSSFALLKAMCDASGADWYNFRNLKGPMAVFYLDTENSDSDLYERYHEYFSEFSQADQELIEKNLHVVFGKEIAKTNGVELELHNTALWDVLERYIPAASIVYLDCWYDLHDAKDSDAKTQKAALQIALQRFKGKTVHIIQHIGREAMENLTKKNGAALRFIGGSAYINRLAQSFVLARKAEAFILQETFELKDEDGNVEEEVVDFLIWGRSIPKLPLLTFHQISFDGEKEYNFRHEIDTKLSKGAASLLFKMKDKGPWDSLRDLLRDVGAGYGGKQKVVLDELRFKGYVKYDIDGIHLKAMSHDVLMSAAKSPAAKKDADIFLARVLMPNGVPNDGMEDSILRELAKAEGIMLMGPLAYKNVQPVAVDGKTIWRMVRDSGRYSLAEAEALRADVAKLIEAEPRISKKELIRRTNSGQKAIDTAVDTLGYSRAGGNGVWRKAQNTQEIGTRSTEADPAPGTILQEVL